jgi:hypothetical protein
MPEPSSIPPRVRRCIALIVGAALVSVRFALTPPLRADDDESPSWLRYSLHGTDALDHYGSALATVGDIDDDGRPDFAVSAIEAIEGKFGKVFVVSGASGTTIRILESGIERAQYGGRVVSGGDLDGDGFQDLLIVGSRLVDAVSARKGALLWREENADYFADTIAILILADLDGDGISEYCFGRHEERDFDRPGWPIDTRGRVTLYSGRTREPIWSHHGAREDDYFGGGIRAVGDVDGDDIADLAVSATRRANRVTLEVNPEPEVVHVLSGRDGAEIRRFSLGIPASGFSAGAAIGDIDGDAVSDLLVRAPSAAFRGFNSAGLVAALSGSTGDVLWSRSGQDFSRVPLGTLFGGDRLGYVASPAGDVDGDGIIDVLVSASRYGSAGFDSGRVYLLSGRDGEVLGAYEAEQTWSTFGASLSPLGDIDGDGRPEFIISAPRWESPRPVDPLFPFGYGAIYVVSWDPDASPRFIRADADVDGDVDLTDGVVVLEHLFRGGEAACLEALDVDRNASVHITDAIIILQHLFRSGAAPQPPYPDCGRFYSLDFPLLSCERSACP